MTGAKPLIVSAVIVIMMLTTGVVLATADGEAGPLLSSESELTGRLRVELVDDFVRPYTRYMLELPGATMVELNGQDTSLFAELQPGTLISVDGVVSGTAITLRADPDIRILGETDEPHDEAGYNPENFGQQDLLGLLTNFNDDTSTPITVQAVMDVMQTTGDKLFREFSWEQMWVNTTVPGYHTANMAATCSQGQITQPAVDAADPDVDYTNIDRITFIFNKNDCSYGGVAQLGKRNLNTDEGTIRVSVLWIPSRSWGVGVWAHESGHNYGVLHGSYLNCNGGNPSTTDLTGCTAEEYGDPWDNMGSAGGRMHYSSSHKRKIGWLNTNNQSYLATTKLGVFDIYPIEKYPPGGKIAEVRVPYSGTTSELTIEFRVAYGYDAGKTGNLYAGVVVHGTWSVSGGGGGSDSHLVDFAPTGTSKTDSALVPGQIYKDTTRGIELAVILVNANFARIRLGPATNDSTPPSIALIYPKDGDLVPGTSITATGNASDNMAVQRVEVAVNNGAYSVATGTDSWSIPLTLLAGMNTICARAMDTSGNMETTSPCPQVMVDGAAPQAAITSPADWTRLPTPDLAITGTASDDLRLDKVEVQLNGGAWSLANGTSNWSARLVVPAGPSQVCARATDGSGKTTTTPPCITVAFDNSPPEVLITSPKDGEFIGTGLVTVTGTANDNVAVKQVEVQVAGGAFILAQGTATWSLVATLAGGTNTICARAIDTSGNNNSINPCHTVTVDAAPPQVTIASPTDGAFVSSPDVPVSGTASDDLQLARVELQLNGGAWSPATGAATWSASLTLPESAASICARAVDSLGKMTASPPCVKVTYDKTPPTITITGPKDGVLVNQAVIKTFGNASDNFEVASVDVRLNGGQWATASGTTSWTADLTLAEGKNDICAQAHDKAGLVTAAPSCVTLTLDSTPPAVSIASPANGVTVPAEALKISGGATDATKVKIVEIRIGGGGWSEAQGTDVWETTVNLAAAGLQEICARGTDAAGNVGAGTDCVTVTSLQPRVIKEVRITPTSAEVVPGGAVQFAAEALDTEGRPLPRESLESLRWAVISGSGKVDQDGLFTAGNMLGINQVQVTARFNGVPKSAIAEVKVSRDGGVGLAGTMAFLTSPLFLGIIATVIVAITILGILASRRKKKANPAGLTWMEPGAVSPPGPQNAGPVSDPAAKTDR